MFNRHVKRIQRERSATNVEQSRQVDYLRDEIALRLCERLLDVNRHLPKVLDLGANACNIARALTKPAPLPSDAEDVAQPPPLSSRFTHLTCADSSRELLYRDADLPFNSEIDITREHILDEENPPYEPQTFDAVLSSLSMHWVNDLPSCLARINRILKPDSPFIGVMLGGDTLFELRTSLQLAELERRGGLAPHVSPLADVRDIGGLLTRAGFKMLTVDVDDLVVEYPNMPSLMQDLQAMGESNAILGREQGASLSRDTMLAAEAIYHELHGDDASEPGRLPATFRMIYMIGWTEGANQPKPLARGSGQANLKDILEHGKDFKEE